MGGTGSRSKSPTSKASSNGCEERDLGSHVYSRDDDVHLDDPSGNPVELFEPIIPEASEAAAKDTWTSQDAQ